MTNGRDLVRATARETVAKAVQLADEQAIQYVGATVVASNNSYGNATTVGYGSSVGVKLDGDTAGTVTPVVNLTATALPIGARVVIADHPSGMSIIGCSAQAGGRYLIDGKRLTAAAASFVFVNIPQCFFSLELVLNTQVDSASPGPYRNGIQFNGDTTGNYSEDILYSLTGSAATYFGATLATTGRAGQSAGSTAGQSGITRVLLPGYASPALYKTGLVECTCYDTAARIIEHGGTFWHSLAAITSITVLPQAGNFVSGSTIELYGIGVAL